MEIIFCKPGPYSALHLCGEMVFGCFTRHFFLLFPLFKFFWDMSVRDVSLEEKGAQSEYRGNLNCCVHTYTHGLRCLCQHTSNVSLLSLYVSSWWRYRSCHTWKLTCGVDPPKTEGCCWKFLLGLQSQFCFALAVPSWRFFLQVPTFRLISRIKSTVLFQNKLVLPLPEITFHHWNNT